LSELQREQELSLAQVDRDPLSRIKDLSRLVCLNERRFEELKEILKEVLLPLRKKENRSQKNETHRREKSNCNLCNAGSIYDSSLIMSKRDDLWWEREKWDMVIDPENPWGDLSREEEYRLNALLKGYL